MHKTHIAHKRGLKSNGGIKHRSISAPNAHKTKTLSTIKKINKQSSRNFKQSKPYTITSRNLTTQNSSFVPREIDFVAVNKELMEGVGTIVHRSIGRQPSYFSPFALLDHFFLEECSLPRGLGFHPHPHRGVSTLTYILPKPGNGSVKHQDHKGHEGIIGPGDIQFMSAGKGIVHSEMPAGDDAVEGLQLWINLHKDDKFSEPDYQDYSGDQLPCVERDDVNAKIIMGTALGAEASVVTRTPVHYVHYRLKPNANIDHPIPNHWNAFVYILDGDAHFANEPLQCAKSKNTVYFKLGAVGSFEPIEDRNDFNRNQIDPNTGVTVTAGADGCEFVLVAGEPLNDGVTLPRRRGPIVMTTREELDQAFKDFENGVNGFEGSKEFVKNWTI
jgi:redox-sensitive bicupin YhaK (pirin superfamily)